MPTKCECGHTQKWHFRTIFSDNPRWRQIENNGKLRFKHCLHRECCPTFNTTASKCKKWRPIKDDAG